MGKNAKDYQRKYTDPQLRERLKEEIKDSDRGGAVGQWSARKSQLLTQTYEKHGGGYRNSGRRTAAQRHLKEWTAQRWRTESGSTRARHGDETERYLPQHAWEQLSEHQRRRTRGVKRAQSRHGQQYVPNPEEAKKARKSAELDELTAREAIKRARTLSPDQADSALAHEREHKARVTVLRQLEKTTRRS